MASTLPPAPPLHFPEGLPPAPPANELSVEGVLQAVRSFFAKGAAPGPSGVRPDWTRQLADRPGGQSIGHVLGAFAKLLLDGRAPPELAPWIAGTDPLEQDIIAKLRPPSAEHWFGTDEFGRDVYARLVWGARISLSVSISAITLALVVGGTIGLVSGYVGGRLPLPSETI